MSDNKYIDRHYQTPDPPAPYELECFRVYVPKHSLYIGAFWRAYEFFTSWIAWARDPLKKGKAAAAIWRDAYDKARALYEITKGRCEMNVTGIRFHPNNKCLLQVQYDGGEWQTVGDVSDCAGCGGAGGALQFDGVNVSIYNSCDDEFVPTGEPFNPITKGIYDSLYSPSAAGQCNGAANIAAWSKYVSDNSLSLFSTVGVAGAAVSFIIGTLASTAGAGFLTESLIASLLAQFVDEGDLFGDAADLDISTELQNILFPYMQDDGTIREPNFTAAVTALYERRDEEAIDTAARVRWGHETNIISALGPYVISRQNKYAGITDADCSTAEWVHVFDFTTSKHGWVEAHDTGADWETGVGWTAPSYTDPGGSMWRGIAIKTIMPTRTVTGFKAYYEATLGVNEHPTSEEWRIVQLFRDVQDVAHYIDNVPTEEGDSLYTWSGSEANFNAPIFAINVGSDQVSPYADPGGTLTLTKIVMSGIGSDPFS